MEVMNKKRVEEAVKRLELLGVDDDIIAAFRDNHEISVTYISGVVGKMGSIHHKALEAFHKKKINATPYYIIESFINGFQLVSILIVEDVEDDDAFWECEREDAKEGYVYAYVYNVDEPQYSELGDVFVSLEDSALYRID